MSDGLRTAARGLGQLLVTLGVVVLLFTVYELEVTGLYTAREQHDLGSDLTRAWARAPRPAGPGTRPLTVPVSLGAGLARLYLPRLGRDYVEVVVEGISTADLKKGPGHYPGTALPGQIGNTVLSGHRTTYGAPFNHVDELAVGDAVVLETQTAWYTYRVTGTTIVAPTAIGVTYPVPDDPGARPVQRLLTMTTCNPKYSARQRLVVHGLLASALAKGPGVLPPALRGA